MLWVILSLAGAFFETSYYAIIKKLSPKIDQSVLASGVFFCTALVLIVISAVKGFPEILSPFYTSLAITVVLNFIAAILYFRALAITEFSLAIPMISFSPLFLILTSSVILQEYPSRIGIIGYP